MGVSGSGPVQASAMPLQKRGAAGLCWAVRGCFDGPVSSRIAVLVDNGACAPLAMPGCAPLHTSEAVQKRPVFKLARNDLVNRPFAVLKDMLPPREKPQEANAKKRTGNKPERHHRHETQAKDKPAAATPAAKPARRPAPKAAQPASKPAQAAPARKPALTEEQEAARLAEQQKRQAAAERFRRNTAKAEEGLAALIAAYPAVFDRANPRPLAIGIHKELLAASREGRLSVPTSSIRMAIDRWTGSREYLAGLVEAAPRINLQGEADGEVTAAQADTARQTLEKREQRRQARQKAAAERPARNRRGSSGTQRQGRAQPSAQTASGQAAAQSGVAEPASPGQADPQAASPGQAAAGAEPAGKLAED